MTSARHGGSRGQAIALPRFPQQVLRAALGAALLDQLVRLPAPESYRGQVFALAYPRQDPHHSTRLPAINDASGVWALIEWQVFALLFDGAGLGPLPVASGESQDLQRAGSAGTTAP